MKKPRFIQYSSYRGYPLKEMQERAKTFREEMQCRRTIRTFSSRPVPREVIEELKFVYEFRFC